MASVRKRRPKHATKRLDIAAIKEALRDDRVFPCMGLVTDEDVASHFDLDGEDLLIEVALMPGEERVAARMGFGMGPNAGIWSVPPVGTEVALLVCEGELEAGIFIVGILSTGNVPDGIAENVIVIAASSKVLIHDGDGGAQQLVTKADYDALKANFDGHKHAGLLGGTGSVLALTTSPEDPLSTPDPLPAGTFTQVLEGK